MIPPSRSTSARMSHSHNTFMPKCDGRGLINNDLGSSWIMIYWMQVHRLEEASSLSKLRAAGVWRRRLWDHSFSSKHGLYVLVRPAQYPITSSIFTNKHVEYKYQLNMSKIDVHHHVYPPIYQQGKPQP